MGVSIKNQGVDLFCIARAVLSLLLIARFYSCCIVSSVSGSSTLLDSRCHVCGHYAVDSIKFRGILLQSWYPWHQYIYSGKSDVDAEGITTVSCLCLPWLWPESNQSALLQEPNKGSSSSTITAIDFQNIHVAGKTILMWTATSEYFLCCYILFQHHRTMLLSTSTTTLQSSPPQYFPQSAWSRCL